MPSGETRPNVAVPDELAAVRAQMKLLETREAELKSILFADPSTRTGANWLAEIKTIKQSRCDLKEMRANHPALVEEFTFPVEVTRIELCGLTEDGEIVSARKFRSAGK